MKSIQNYFALVYIFVLVAIVGMGMKYLNDLPSYAREKVTVKVVIPKDSVKVPTTDFTETKGSVSAPVDIYKLANPTPELVEKGKTLFTTNCVGCHGESGKGDGVAGASMNPKPRNFTSLDGWTNGPKFTQMYKTLQEGITAKGMASYSTLPVEDRIALIQYIHETFTKTYPKNTEEELKELDKTYSLSTGQKMPNIIPIKSATEKVASENQAVTQKVKSISEAITKNNTDEAAVLFKAVTGNMTKALTLLATDASWLQNENQLYNLIGANPVSNGFKGRASTLSPKEITLIYQFLKNQFESYKG